MEALKQSVVGDRQPVETIVLCENSQGLEIHGTLLRLTRHEVSFELYGAVEPLKISEKLEKFTILSNQHLIYSGRGIVTSLTNAGPVTVCQANLEDSWLEVDILRLAKEPGRLQGAFNDLVEGWQRVYRLSPEYKLVVADIQSFLFELRHWVDEVALGISGPENGPRNEAEMQTTDELTKPITPCLNHLFDQFEQACASVPDDLQAAYGTYAKRQLHPLLLSAPFMHRIYRKPLGYAGDYEMVNMILRSPYEGSSLYAKVLNKWFLSQIPAEAHRNRIKFLAQRLIEEAARTRDFNRPLRVHNLGCGPAQEVALFMQRSDLSDHAEFSLQDFNDETLAYTRQSLESVRQKYQRATRVQLIKKSVGQALKNSMGRTTAEMDVICCAGLFDYLPNRICLQLMNMFHAMLKPGGLLIATNVDPSNPIRNVMAYIFEWRLIERNADQMRALIPTGVNPDDCKISADVTACNIFLEVRKPLSERERS